jgi:hypothetical protein
VGVIFSGAVEPTPFLGIIVLGIQLYTFSDINSTFISAIYCVSTTDF